MRRNMTMSVYEDMNQIYDLVERIYDSAWAKGVNAQMVTGEGFYKGFNSELKNLTFILQEAMNKKAMNDLKQFETIPEEDF